MLDIRFIRDNTDRVKESSAQKGYKVDVDGLLKLDDERREILTRVEDLRRERNELTESAQGVRPSDEQITKGQELKNQLSELEDKLRNIDEKYLKDLNSIPNITYEDVPQGGEEDSVELKKWGDQKTGAKDHLDLALERDWIDFERGAKVAGTKFYFLKGDLALLENALIQYGIDFVTKKGFSYMTVPHLVNTRTAAGAGFAPRGDESSNEYFIEGEDLTLIGTSEAPLTGFHADEILDEDKLPLLYAGFSPSYRKEAGTYGKHTRGLFRVHQFNKIEMYAFTLPEHSQQMHEKILAIEEELWQALGIPYHLVNIAAGDLGAPAAKKYDIEYWSPVDNAYRELTSCSNCTDYQARNLNIRVRRKDGSIQVVHTLNGTAIALTRSLVTILENYQTEDGKVKVPDVLKPYLGNREVL